MKTEVCLHGQKNANKSIHLYSKQEVLSCMWSIVPNLWPVKWHSAFKSYADQAAKQGQSAAEFLRAPAKFKVQRKSEKLSLPGGGKKTVQITSDWRWKFQVVHSADTENRFIRCMKLLQCICSKSTGGKTKKRKTWEIMKRKQHFKLNYLLHHIVNSGLLSCKNEN